MTLGIEMYSIVTSVSSYSYTDIQWCIKNEICLERTDRKLLMSPPSWLPEWQAIRRLNRYRNNPFQKQHNGPQLRGGVSGGRAKKRGFEIQKRMMSIRSVWHYLLIIWSSVSSCHLNMPSLGLVIFFVGSGRTVCLSAVSVARWIAFPWQHQGNAKETQPENSSAPYGP